MLQHPVPEALLARIGDMTVSFALVESEVQSLVGSLIRDDERIIRPITAELSFRNLRAVVMSLYGERHGEDAGEALHALVLRALMKRAAELEHLRNQITHSVWGAGETAGTITRIKMTAKEKHGLRFDFQNVTAQDLGEVVDDMKRLAEDIQRFRIELA
jgi:hypothetical protein